MRFATISIDRKEQAVIVASEGLIPISAINQKEGTNWYEDLFSIIKANQIESIRQWYETNLDYDRHMILTASDQDFQPLYRHPSKIWCIGLNYVAHAEDLDEKAPTTEPASFMKPDTTIIGPYDTIEIPRQSRLVDAEAELGIIIGKECKNISEEEAPNVVAGFTTILDMTAIDILKKNPRYLTRAKSFDTFFSFGPHFITIDEVENVNNLEVTTVINGTIHRQDKVSNMTFTPWKLVSFHSKVMTLKPGDIISTGSPGGAFINEGDVVECRINGFKSLVNYCKDLKIHS